MLHFEPATLDIMTLNVLHDNSWVTRITRNQTLIYDIAHISFKSKIACCTRQVMALFLYNYDLQLSHISLMRIVGF